MACSKYASKRQTTHAARMSRLLFGPCTDILRDVLRIHIKETSFPATLQNRKVKGTLLSLRNLQASQRELLYPRVGTFSGSYEDFDISLLYLLLRNITNITPHSNGWGSPPDQIDRSVSANIDRIRTIRNQIGAHWHRHDLSDAVFSTSWAKLKRSVIEVVRSTSISTNYEQFINDLANEPMDTDLEDYWLKVLQKQIQHDVEKYQEIVKNAESIQEKIKRISNEQDKQRQIQRNQGEVQTKHRTTLTDHEERLKKQGEVQSKHEATLIEQKDRLDKQSKAQTKQWTTLIKHEDSLTEQGHVQNKQEATLIEHEKRLKKQEEAKDQEAKNIFDNTKAVLQYHKSSKTYIRTEQVDSVIQKLRKDHFVMLTGRPGDGKSTIAKQVLCELSEGFEYVPVIITEPNEWKKIISSNETTVAYIDDIFGSINADTSAVDKWKTMFDYVISSYAGKISVLTSSRRSIIADVRKSCHKRFLSPEYEIDLVSNKLTKKEKASMLLQYEKKHIYRASELTGDRFRRYEEEHGKDSAYQLNSRENDDIVRSEPYYGFPQTCFLFFARKYFFELGTDFFIRANITLFDNIDSMRKSRDEQSKVQYCTLAYVFLEGSIHIRDVKEGLFQEICEKSNSSKWRDVDIEGAIQELNEIYLSPSNHTHVFTFCHVTIREAVAASFGKLAPDIVIQKCSSKTVHELIRTEGYAARDGEVILTIRKKYYPLLANRLLNEEKHFYTVDQYIHSAVRHPATDDAEFTPVLFEVINKSPHTRNAVIKWIWNDITCKLKPALYREILTRHGPHHIKHKAEYDSDMSVDEHDSDTSVERPYLITCEQVIDRLENHLYWLRKQAVISIIRYVISNCDVNYFLNNAELGYIRGLSVLHCCVVLGWTDVVDEILNALTPTKTKNNWSSLHFAAFFGRLELFKKFEKLCPNVLETTREGYNILQVVLLRLRYGMSADRYYLSVSDTDNYVRLSNISQHETDFANILQHVITWYPSLITSIDMPLDDYNNNIVLYLVIHDRQQIYDMLVEKKKDIIFHRKSTELPTTLHVAAYLGRAKFVEKLWKAGVRAEMADLSVTKCIESGQEHSSRTVKYGFNMKTWIRQWHDQHGTVINNFKLKSIGGQPVRFGCTEDYIAISSNFITDN